MVIGVMILGGKLSTFLGGNFFSAFSKQMICVDYFSKSKNVMHAALHFYLTVHVHLLR